MNKEIRSLLRYWIDGIRFYKPWQMTHGHRIEEYKRLISVYWNRR